MLVVSRKEYETIKIGESIVITILKNGKGRTRVGIQAPRDMQVLRGELANHSDHSDSTTEDPAVNV